MLPHAMQYMWFIVSLLYFVMSDGAYRKKASRVARTAKEKSFGSQMLRRVRFLLSKPAL